MRKFITFVPVNRNDGSKVSDAEMYEIMTMFLSAFGGVTLSDPAIGMWAQDGKVYTEPVRQLLVAAEDDQLNEFRQIVLDVGKQLGQLAMFLEVGDSEIEIINVDQA